MRRQTCVFRDRVQQIPCFFKSEITKRKTIFYVYKRVANVVCRLYKKRERVTAPVTQLGATLYQTDLRSNLFKIASFRFKETDLSPSYI